MDESMIDDQFSMIENLLIDRLLQSSLSARIREDI
jgi:hypothetical protein